MTPLANIFQPLIDVFNAVIVFFHDDVGAGWGTAIILLTVCVRALMLPLGFKQYRSMQEMQRAAPQIKALRDKYKDDPQRLQQETMKFYQEHKINPFASCLPIVAQLPVFLALFYALREDLREDICGTRTRPCADVAGSFGEDFLFIPDITDKATGGVLAALIVLYIGSQLLSSLTMMTSATDRNQKIIFLALPFVFVLFIFSFPAGLIVYWITTNFWTVGQQQLIRRIVGKPEPLPVTVTPGKAKPARGAAGAAPDGSSAAAEGEGGRSKAPPPPPRRKRKKTGRRR